MLLIVCAVTVCCMGLQAKEPDSLRHFKDSVQLVTKGQECGVGLDGADCRPGDYLQAFELEPRLVDIYGEPIKLARTKKA